MSSRLAAKAYHTRQNEKSTHVQGAFAIKVNKAY
jgi:hypothetical protein